MNPKTDNQLTATQTQEQIARRAYEIWERRGRPFGYERENWLAAEKELSQEAKAVEQSEAAPRAAKETIPEKESVPSAAKRMSPRTNAPATPQSSNSGSNSVKREWASTEQETYVIVSDRGHLRIYADTSGEDRFGHHLVLAESLDFPDGVHSYTSRNADQAGRFPGADGPSGGMSIDERLPLERQRDRKLAKTISGQISSFIRAHPSARWHFAAGPALHRLVLDELDSESKNTLGESLQKDLVNEPVARLRSHFSRLPV